MKKIQIILAILIVLGLGALATQKLWVPNLTNFILEKENKNSKNPVMTEEIEKIKTEETNLTGKYCYSRDQLAINKDSYEVHETLELNFEGKKVTGSKTGNQKGPDMTNGYFGEITGEIVEDKIESIFSFTIEGSQAKEKEIYQIESDKLIKLHYPLKEENGVLVPDLVSIPNGLIYNKIDCI